MASPAIEINSLVRMLNKSTERVMNEAETTEFDALRAKTTEGRMADNATIRRIQELRLACVDLEKRREMVVELNAGLSGISWRFALENGRITAQPRM